MWRLLNIDAENAADLGHRTVYTAGQAAHACCRGKGDQSDDQHVLHDSLTSFVVVQTIQRTQYQVFHWFFSPWGLRIGGKMARPINYEPPLGDATGGPSLALGIYHCWRIVAVTFAFLYNPRPTRVLQGLMILFHLILPCSPEVQSFAVSITTSLALL
jgi:hypothetical protein